MYQDTSTVAAWEECFSKTMGMLGMKRALTAEVEGRCAQAFSILKPLDMAI
jgi:hypothetical protein